MIITFSGNTTDFFRDAFYNSSTSGFDVTVVSTSATQIVVRNDSTGFTTTFTATPGTHNVCIHALNANAGNNTLLGCRTITVTATA